MDLKFLLLLDIKQLPHLATKEHHLQDLKVPHHQATKVLKLKRIKVR